MLYIYILFSSSIIPLDWKSPGWWQTSPWKVIVKKSSKVFTTQKMKFSIKDFCSKCDQIRSFLRIWLHLLKKPLMENFMFCAVIITVDKLLGWSFHWTILPLSLGLDNKFWGSFLPGIFPKDEISCKTKLAHIIIIIFLNRIK